MQTRKWHEAESIELIKWTHVFSNYAISLPRTATYLCSNKTFEQVLRGTDTIHHSAIHRLPTSAQGTLDMLEAAVEFTKSLRDSERMRRLEDIKSQLETGIQKIVQHQTLLEHRLGIQLESIGRQRANLDELKKSSIEEVLAKDSKQCSEVGSALEDFLVRSQDQYTAYVRSQSSCSDQATLNAGPSISTDQIGMLSLILLPVLSRIRLPLLVFRS